ncbi:type VI secretion system baseplate subunit TssF [Chitinophaga pinensis]|uniref:Type VI secretion system baseplate subunit TssF n=1 Tax=Chitinophaga pinensis (strain ATCC 43595 / DSM 2588 / LMG 13176 / NBRC 15968 / NCIMB 11800 / UQM 2034) TaxID=485918 RepID=A0A979G7Y2_CHIPD|nr:type VI secretion system baseplate subunit TssF [Chitinophaga pinensis]ACU62303.1 hypothetical protein Cpin_4869 [Chitinophaga pinensis DSM 2588]
MNELFYSSKDEIRNRVLKHAREYWGLAATADFDPLVKLLIEALSTELFNISNEVSNLQNRMVDKLSGILAPDTLISAIPAHAVLHARPVEIVETIDEKSRFYYGKRMVDKEENNREMTMDLFFSPLQPVKLFNANVAYIATGNNLFQVDDQQQRSLLTQAKPGQQLAPNSFYVGVKVPGDLPSVDGMTFYFDWKNYQVERQTYDLLSFAAWSVRGHVLKVVQDHFYDVAKAGIRSPFEEREILHILLRDVSAYYRHRFYTLTDIAWAPALLEPYPAAFATVFAKNSLEPLKDDLLWIKIQVPATIQQHMLNELSVSINAFPVVNKKRHDSKNRLKIMTDIIPLKMADHEQLLSVDSLRDNMGNRYTEIPQGYNDERSAGLFSVRYGGTERFDKRNAREILDYLFELLRDEKAAFAAYGTDFLNTALKELEQNISMIAQKTGGQQHTRELLNYLVFKPLDHADILFLEYWTTNAELANNIRSGSRLQPFESARIQPDSLLLLSTTQGGRSRLNAANRVRAYKYGLTTGDRIVTQTDIVNFCHWEFGSHITGVELRKGLVKSAKPKDGFVKTVDLILTPAAGNELKAEDWNALLELARTKLQMRSTMHLHYRLMLA